MFFKTEPTGPSIMNATASKRRCGAAGFIILTWVAIGMVDCNAIAASISLTWDPNPESDLAGYRIHYGTASRSYSFHIDVGNATRYTVSDLMDGVVYYFAATAYDASGNESSYSEEAVNAPDPCDLDFDGDVDGSDLSLFIAAYEAGLIEADLNQDLSVDGSDLAAFARGFHAGD